HPSRRAAGDGASDGRRRDLPLQHRRQGADPLRLRRILRLPRELPGTAQPGLDDVEKDRGGRLPPRPFLSSVSYVFTQPNSAGRVPSQASRSSSRLKVATSWISNAPDSGSTTPVLRHGSPRAEHISVNRSSSVLGTATTTRPADSENNCTNGSTSGSSTIRAPHWPIRAISTRVC